jgi:hypothetical protein
MKVSPFAIGLILAAAPLGAVSIPITNFSFEAPILGTPGGFTPTVPGWVTTGTEAVFQPAIPGQANAVPDGVQVLALGFGNPGSASQDTGVALVANTVYTLGLDVLARNDVGFSTYTVSLFAGATLLATQNTLVVPTTGNFLADILTYTSSALPPVGTLTVVLQADGGIAGVGAGQADFDNVTLDAVAGTVPEPSALVLGGLGLLPLLFFRRRK